VTALAIALAWIGTLAACCFAAWLQQRHAPRDVVAGLSSLESRIVALEKHVLLRGNYAEDIESRLRNLSLEINRAFTDGPQDYAEIRETVSTLALASGMRRKGVPVSKG
jgi:hypothetical protein